MTNYNLEEIELIKKQIILSCFSILGIFVSLSLSYNEILKLDKNQSLYSKNDERQIQILNRFIIFIIALLFLIINVLDNNLKIKYRQKNENSKLQIYASVFTLIATIIVLYVAINGIDEDIEIENPEI